MVVIFWYLICRYTTWNNVSPNRVLFWLVGLFITKFLQSCILRPFTMKANWEKKKQDGLTVTEKKKCWKNEDRAKGLCYSALSYLKKKWKNYPLLVTPIHRLTLVTQHRSWHPNFYSPIYTSTKVVHVCRLADNPGRPVAPSHQSRGLPGLETTAWRWRSDIGWKWFGSHGMLDLQFKRDFPCSGPPASFRYGRTTKMRPTHVQHLECSTCAALLWGL